MKFVSKPIVIEAIQYDGKNHAEVLAFCRALAKESKVDIPDALTLVPGAKAFWFVNRDDASLVWLRVADMNEAWGDDIVAAVYDVLHDTWVGVKHGQWIICGTKGEFYPCDDEVFRAKYTQVFPGEKVN